MMGIEIYTDGGCRNNPGIGAWGFIVVSDGMEMARSSGFSEMTTNNIMELTAVLEAEKWLEANCREECEVTIYSDSQYVVNTMLVWYDGYMRSNKWMKKKNIELIREVMGLYDGRQRRDKIVWVKGHADNRYNVLVDELVNETMDGRSGKSENIRSNELTYWVAFATMQGITQKRKNDIYGHCFTHVPKIDVVRLFEETALWREIGLSDDETVVMEQTRREMPNYAFLVDELIAQGYSIITVADNRYLGRLKANLRYSTPTVLYAKGNLDLLLEKAVAIVGSRNADDNSLLFTENVARKATRDGAVVVSGFAKGVDRKALDAALEAGGKSIIVLPQGIMTFASGFKEYYKHIVEGRVLVVSNFHPKMRWSVAAAMERNNYIYGLADNIYVAISDEKGGTWSGVTEGLKKGREIFVRVPFVNEKCANMLLIQRGAKGVDINGEIMPGVNNGKRILYKGSVDGVDVVCEPTLDL